MSDLARLHAEMLSTVHQQFTHMLILGGLGESLIAARIKETDDQDFKTSMAIVDRLSRMDAFVSPAHRVRFGRDVPEILALETAMENRLCAALSGYQGDPEVKARATAPRAAYADWLGSQGASAPIDSSDDPAAEGLIVDLLLLMELSLTNAYRRRAAGDGEGADRNWRICGASMMHLMAIARFAPDMLANDGGFLIPEAHFFTGIETKLREAAGRCANAADEAAAQDGKAAKLLRRIADDCRAIERTSFAEPLTLSLGDSRAFDDFERSRRLVDA